MTNPDDDPYHDRRHNLFTEVAALANDVADACPGPHRVVQHRDHKPPWCRACRRTAYGLPIPARRTP